MIELSLQKRSGKSQPQTLHFQNKLIFQIFTHKKILWNFTKMYNTRISFPNDKLLEAELLNIKMLSLSELNAPPLGDRWPKFLIYISSIWLKYVCIIKNARLRYAAIAIYMQYILSIVFYALLHCILCIYIHRILCIHIHCLILYSMQLYSLYSMHSYSLTYIVFYALYSIIMVYFRT